MTNIIHLAERRPEPNVWRCRCGTVSFWLWQDGRIECCGCHKMQNTGGGIWIVPDPKTIEVVPFPQRDVMEL